MKVKRARQDFASVDEYIASQPEAVRSMLRRVRGAIRKAVPDAEEVISYHMPTYKLGGRPMLYFAGWRHHYSLYPATDRLVAALSDELAPHARDKGTIRLPFSEAVPVRLIERVARFRAREVAEREKARATTPRKRQTSGRPPGGRQRRLTGYRP
jgi:uncharacterized protein YdhG (YjbR/CyaY superfamily)